MWKTAFSIHGKEDSVKETQEGVSFTCNHHKFCSQNLQPGKLQFAGLGKELPAKLCFASAPVRSIFVGVTFYVAPTCFIKVSFA